MSGTNKFEININIAGREFKVYVAPEAEGNVRATAKLITETFEKYREKFPKEDFANILAKTSLHLLVEQRQKAQLEDSSDLMDGLYQLEENLENFIAEEL